MISGFFFDSDFSASSPVARRRAVVLNARRAMNEAIGTAWCRELAMMDGIAVGGARRFARVASLDVLSYD